MTGRDGGFVGQFVIFCDIGVKAFRIDGHTRPQCPLPWVRSWPLGRLAVARSVKLVIENRCAFSSGHHRQAGPCQKQQTHRPPPPQPPPPPPPPTPPPPKQKKKKKKKKKKKHPKLGTASHASPRGPKGHPLVRAQTSSHVSSRWAGLAPLGLQFSRCCRGANQPAGFHCPPRLQADQLVAAATEGGTIDWPWGALRRGFFG